MERRNPDSSSGLKWEIVAANLMPSSGSDNNNSNALFGSSSKYPISASQESTKAVMNGFGKTDSLFPNKALYDDVIRMPGTSSTPAFSDEPKTGLRLGRQKEYGDSFPSNSNMNNNSINASISSIPVSSTPTKRSRSSFQNMQNPCCQVEGCNLDLKSAKDYHRRHRICERHSKSPKVTVAGMERRFCQQCSRFHDLSEFDDKKRSCRRRLSDHNARRRRVQPESIQLSSSGLSSALYDQRQQNVLLNGLPVSLPNPTWENTSTSMLRQTITIRPAPKTPCFSGDEIHNSISNLHMDSERLSSIQSSNPRVLDQCLHSPATNPSIAPDLLSAHSLLSSNSWSLNSVSYSSSMEPHHLSLFDSNSNSNIPDQQVAGAPVSMVDSVHLHSAGASSHHQGYRLFNDDDDDDNNSGGFYSGRMSL